MRRIEQGSTNNVISAIFCNNIAAKKCGIVIIVIRQLKLWSALIKTKL